MLLSGHATLTNELAEEEKKWEIMKRFCHS